MENNVPASKGALGYGALVAVAIIVYSLILFLLDLDTNQYLNYVSYVILLIGIYLASLNFREKYQGGSITYGKAVGVGFFTALVASVIVAIYTFVYFTAINPGAYEEAMMIAEQQLVERGMTDTEIEQSLKVAEMFQSPWISAVFALLGNVIIGVILALITSIFVKREAPQTEE